MKNKKFIEQAFEHAYLAVSDIQQRVAALHYAVSSLQKNKWNSGIKYRAQDEFGSLHSQLYDLLNDAYAKVFMWGVVSCDRKLMARAKKLAFDHYLKENSEIMSYLDFHNEFPSALEEEFRKELDFLEKNSSNTIA